VEYFAAGSPQTIIDEARSCVLLGNMLTRLGPCRRVLLVPPDYTRVHSGAGELTCQLYELLKSSAEVEILPALGTHVPMTAAEREAMFPGILAELFREHDWRRDLVHLGDVPRASVREITGGLVDFPIRCEINRHLVEGRWDRIISIGQLVPHEVVGIANHAKNIFVGTGGADTINKTHFVGAVCGMETAMGRTRTPVRAVLDYMARHFAAELPISYVLTVRERDETGELVTRGLFAGDDAACFERGSALCREVNITLLDEPIKKAVVYLDPDEFKSTWLGNKAIYRLRMAMADGGRLIVLAPGVHTFGEDAAIDALIRRYGYCGTPRTLAAVRENADLAGNLAAAAHLIHGSSEGRFSITYCPGGLDRATTESVGFAYGDLAEMSTRYPRSALRDGWNDHRGERVFYVSNPALGLWAARDRFIDATV
jgi:nickel-dependent lactate racemase